MQWQLAHYSVSRDYWQNTTLGAVSPELHKLFSDKIATHGDKFKHMKIDKAVGSFSWLG
ncbi:MAG TPA: hypothetical protein VKC66_26295 [Xanthobacteraceae bacterium]|nr:hypothetical protein [Xanthobacteraceae bacterium]